MRRFTYHTFGLETRHLQESSNTAKRNHVAMHQKFLAETLLQRRACDSCKKLFQPW